MVEIIAVAVVGILGFFSGWHAREQAAVRKIDELLKHIGEDIEEANASSIRITIEQHNGVYYVHNMDDNSFMGQGKTRKELEEVLASKFPGKTFAAAHKNLVEMGWANESV